MTDEVKPATDEEIAREEWLPHDLASWDWTDRLIARLFARNARLFARIRAEQEQAKNYQYQNDVRIKYIDEQKDRIGTQNQRIRELEKAIAPEPQEKAEGPCLWCGGNGCQLCDATVEIATPAEVKRLEQENHRLDCEVGTAAFQLHKARAERDALAAKLAEVEKERVEELEGLIRAARRARLRVRRKESGR
jgi:small-conductance mechanosensitive channel